MERPVSPNTEWQDALRIARIMARPNPLEPPAKKRRSYSRRHKFDVQQPEPTPVEPVKTPKPKVFPFVSRSRWDRYIDRDLREFVYQRDGGRCFYCHCDVPLFGAHLDHVLPVSRGGMSIYSNLVLSCRSCNCSKSASVLENLDDILAEVRRRNQEVYG
jgi:5-methylcytosine-specific restriction endonuclease McrA